jgi:hypothetical protein
MVQDIFDATCVTLHDEKERLRKLQVQREEFVHQALVLATAVVLHETLPPGTPPLLTHADVGGMAGGEKFTDKTRSILLKHAHDVHGIYGDDERAQKGARLEVQALNAVVDSGLRQIHVPLTALVKIRGRLIYATSIAPLQQLVVGSDDAGSTQSHVHDGTAFPMARTLSMQLARILHLQPHPVYVGSTRSASTWPLALAMDVEMHVCSDGRVIILDAARLFPPTTPIVPSPSLPGAVSTSEARMGYLTEHIRPELLQKAKQLGLPALSADAFSPFSQRLYSLGYTNAEAMATTAHELAVVRVCNELLVGRQMPALAAALDAQAAAHGGGAGGGAGLDTEPMAVGQGISRLFHEYGVNLRYRCMVATHCKQAHSRRLLLQEHVVRVMKRSTERLWRDVCRTDGDARQVLRHVTMQWCTKNAALTSVLQVQ